MLADPASPANSALRPLPEHLARLVWRGGSSAHMSSQTDIVIPSGHAPLDAELPGGGWPTQAMTEILQPQPAQAEWRLLAPALSQLVRQGGSVLLIGAPQTPHLPALRREGLLENRLIRIDAQTPAERLWATEQAVKSRCVIAILSWLPQARAEQLRRLQACAVHHPGLFFVFRPQTAQGQSSAAPLRVLLALGPSPHPLQLRIIKRRGPLLDQVLTIGHWPWGLHRLTQRTAVPVSDPSVQQPTQPATTPTTIVSRRPQPLSHLVAPHAVLDGPDPRSTAPAAFTAYDSAQQPPAWHCA